MHKILIVEDNQALSSGIVLALQSEDIEIEQCHDVKSAQSVLADQDYDLLILDVNLPDGSALLLRLQRGYAKNKKRNSNRFVFMDDFYVSRMPNTKYCAKYT